MIRVSPSASNGPSEVLVDGGGGAGTDVNVISTVGLTDAELRATPVPVDIGAVGTLDVAVVNTPDVNVTDDAARDLGKVDVASLDQYTPVSGRLPVDGSGVTQPISAAALPLPTGAATAALQTQPGVDIGDVTVNNASGAAAVNIQDGGNSITVDATSLPLPTGAATEATLASLKAALTVTALQVTASGDTTLVSSGTRKLKRVEASNSHATTALVAGLKIASVNGGAVFGKKYLPAAGGLAVWNFLNDYIQVTSEAIVANLSAAGQVEFTAYYE